MNPIRFDTVLLYFIKIIIIIIHVLNQINTSGQRLNRTTINNFMIIIIILLGL